ncbi:MAG: hypothetical protein FGM24_09390 [Candidatus Kapabacteria bacterium]|nr:hypothetical protein [Candidatus Kapabacteria bacterium]
MPATDIILLRHATAERLRPGLSDTRRELTSEGRLEAERMSMLLAATVARNAVLCSSPAVRAMQTANALSRATSLEINIEPRLGLDGNVDTVLDVIRELASTPVIIVGHLPVIAQAAAMLLQMPVSSVAMPPGAAIGMQWHGRSGSTATLCWMVTPEIVVRL